MRKKRNVQKKMRDSEAPVISRLRTSHRNPPFSKVFAECRYQNGTFHLDRFAHFWGNKVVRRVHYLCFFGDKLLKI